MTQLFTTDVSGIGPFCVEFEDGEIITTRSKERQCLIATAPELLEIVRKAESRIVCQCIEIRGDNPDCLHHRIEAVIAKAECPKP